MISKTSDFKIYSEINYDDIWRALCYKLACECDGRTQASSGRFQSKFKCIWRVWIRFKRELVNKLSIIASNKNSYKKKQKGRRINYYKRVYLHKQINKGDWSFVWIAFENNLSLETLYNIKMAFDVSTRWFI